MKYTKPDNMKISRTDKMMKRPKHRNINEIRFMWILQLDVHNTTKEEHGTKYFVICTSGLHKMAHTFFAKCSERIFGECNAIFK